MLRIGGELKIEKFSIFLKKEGWKKEENRKQQISCQNEDWWDAL